MRLFGKAVSRTSKDRWPGFTLLELLVGLIVVSVVVLSSQWLFRLEYQLRRPESVDSALSWHLFLNQLENQTSLWEFVMLDDPQRLTLFDRESGTNFTIEFLERPRGGVIRKRQANGYEPVLMKVEEMAFSVDGTKVKLKVVMSDGQHYEADFYQWFEP